MTMAMAMAMSSLASKRSLLVSHPRVHSTRRSRDSVSCQRASQTRSEFCEQSGRRHLDARAACVLGLGAVAGTVMAFPAAASEVAAVNLDAWSALVASEPKNALSLPTWIIHVASVAEWITAMALVWRYGDTPGNSSWKGLSWGMVPLLGGAMCACTWHFFYNARSLEILVILQAALTVIGNFTMWIAAFRIYQASQEQQSKLPPLE